MDRVYESFNLEYVLNLIYKKREKSFGFKQKKDFIVAFLKFVVV